MEFHLTKMTTAMKMIDVKDVPESITIKKRVEYQFDFLIFFSNYIPIGTKIK